MFNPELRRAKKSFDQNTKFHLDNEKKRARWGKQDLWPMFDSGRDSYFKNLREAGSIGGFSELADFDQVKEFVDSLHELGEQVVCLDVMGQGVIGSELGCDVSLGTTLPLPDDFQGKEAWLEEKKSRGIDLIEGDIFSRDTQARLFDELDELAGNGNKLALVFFRPGAGDKGVSGNIYAEQVLADELFIGIFERVLLGGKLFISLANYPIEKREEFVDFIRLIGTEVDIETSDSFYGSIMITKTA